MISLSPPSYLTGRSAVRRRSGPPGNRTPITWVQTRRLPIGLAARVNCVVVLSVLCPFSSLSFQFFIISARGPFGNRTRSSSLPKTRATGALTDLFIEQSMMESNHRSSARRADAVPLDHWIESHFNK
jgi:hypothetical protein